MASSRDIPDSTMVHVVTPESGGPHQSVRCIFVGNDCSDRIHNEEELHLSAVALQPNKGQVGLMRNASNQVLISVLGLCLSGLLGCGSTQVHNASANTVINASSGAYSQYAVAADHPAASEAGAEVLAQGGSAADAAAATMLALGVANPPSSGMGGGAFILYFNAEDQSFTYIDARERAPAASTANMYVEREAEARENGEDFSEPLTLPSQLGGLASGVPGEPAGIDALLERFGTVSRETVFAPAIRLASEGVAVSAKLADSSVRWASRLRRDPVMRTWFESADAPGLREGQILRQPELANTLRAFAAQGASAIYTGPIAEAIVEANRREGGMITREDLAGYEVRIRQPLDREHFGFRWVTAPPPSAGGFTMLESLALLERWVAPEDRRMSSLWLHALAESWKGPYLDRARYFGDPDHVQLPLEALVANGRVSARSELFSPERATPSDRFSMPLPDQPVAVQPEGGGTSHLCVVDAAGNVAAITSTVNLPFGAGYTAAGMVMNDEMDDFARGVGLANAFGLPGAATNLPGPGRRPVSTMSPTIILRNGQPVLCIGASGGSRIVTATQQVALRHLLFDVPIDAAVAAPRVHHQGLPDTLRSEETVPLDPALLQELIARGHSHELISNVAVVQAISIAFPTAERVGGPGRHQSGAPPASNGASVNAATDAPRLIAVSDPRKGGSPRGR